MKKPSSIGILGGAGPMAGAALFERVIELSTSRYGCAKDSDFPEIFLISFPFSEMLTPSMDAEIVRNELKHCLKRLRENNASVLTIACNTLHAFLDTDDENCLDFVHLPRCVAEAIPSNEIPLVLCTSTSRQFSLHQRFFPCSYPNFSTQHKVDEIIDLILKGGDEQLVISKLLSILEDEVSRTIVLGCTELSLFAKALSSSGKLIIDPIEIAANRVVEKSFLNCKEW